eukprot:CAMPEP_0194202362 /NCGR_PEP_ID=MMETSP0156-20130528/2404_1 /TAXON_ID=33649 /ORGANISM="Thalassionema nitzschioides, Strain L26-B" /LENGTH=643 /DNA_ID=CAMNT_0038927833 /DNA_START=92 /DNA_END=2023 /DNA_ORIENTATION=-
MVALSSSSTHQGGGECPSPLPHQSTLREQSQKAIHNFFYPSSEREASASISHQEAAQSSSSEHHQLDAVEDEENRLFVEQFWKYYDDIIMLSIFTQLGILFRLGASSWFSIFDGTFRSDSALFVNLPLNSLSCFLMGALSSGSDMMSIIETRFTPTKRQDEVHDSANTEEEENLSPRLKRLRRRKRNRIFHSTQRKSDDEFRQVQLLALERRIRASPSLLLFPVGREEADLMGHYFEDGYQKNRNDIDEEGITVKEMTEDDEEDDPPSEKDCTRRSSRSNENAEDSITDDVTARNIDYGVQDERDLDQIIYDVSVEFAGHVSGEMRNLGDNLQRLKRVTLQDGWDVGTTPKAMSEDLMLGLRDGFCGALSSFSSWNSSMVALIRSGNIQEAFVGYMLGIQLPIVSYRFGQHMAMYVFVWRCRREVRTDERRGYGIQLTQEDADEDCVDFEDVNSGVISEQSTHSSLSVRRQRFNQEEELANRRIPSVRSVATALFVLAMVAQFTSLFFYVDSKDQLIALSLLFSPFGVLTRWRLSRYNSVRPGFPLGTFTCNLLACALSGSLGTLLAGNPGPEERIVLVAFISGFGGTLSSVANFIVEVLKGVDPLLFKWNGFYYAICTIFWGMVIGLVSVSTVDWADEVAKK